jgi:hypothetical protein
MAVQEPNISQDAPSRASVVLRLFWMLLGNAIVFGSLATIIVNELAFPTLLDGVIWLAVALISAARWADITRYHGTTATGEDATPADWRRHTLILVLVTALGSVVAHWLGG